ncbi:MAG: prephenate dehydratase domain-containing protein [Candidatus Firestonebacteria bacterium]
MSLKNIRKQIDKIDHRILNLLNERAKLVLNVKHFKKCKSKDYYVPDREVKIYNLLIKNNKGPFPNKSVKSIFKEIISASRDLQASLRVAYLNQESTFTYLASLQHFGSSVKHIAVKSISDIFAEVESNRCDYGVMPIESSTEGVITHALDMFIDSDLRICAEILSTEDIFNNYTRFLIIGKKYVPKTGDDKTSILFSIRDKTGVLDTMLIPFKKHGINLSNIESRPSIRKASDYYFFIDFVGHLEDKKVAKALNELEKECLFLKILGSYPAAIKV